MNKFKELVEQECQPIDYGIIFSDEPGILIYKRRSPPNVVYAMECSASKEILRALPLLRELGFGYFGFDKFEMEGPVPENPYKNDIFGGKWDVLEILKESRAVGIQPIGLEITADGAGVASKKATVYHESKKTAWELDGSPLYTFKTVVNLSDRVDEIRKKELVKLFQKNDELKKGKMVTMSHMSREVLKRSAQESGIRVVEIFLLPEDKTYNIDFACHFRRALEEFGVVDGVMFPWTHKYSDFGIGSEEIDWIIVPSTLGSEEIL